MNFDALEQQYGLPTGLLSAVAQAESGGDPNAVSPKGARGMFQFMPATAQQYGINPLDPNQAADGAARYYSDLLKQNNGNLDAALASYNFGPGNVAAGKPLPQETQDYISKVKGLMPAPQQYADSGQIMSDAAPDTAASTDNAQAIIDELKSRGLDENGKPLKAESDNAENTDDKDAIRAELQRRGLDENGKPINTAEDVAKSAAVGVPEALFGATPLGLGLNATRGVSDLARWAAGKAYKANLLPDKIPFTDLDISNPGHEDLPHYSSNPVPTSNDVLRTFAQAGGQSLYDPKTVPGEYANSIVQFATGGKTAGVPLRTTIPAAVASETAGQATRGTDWEVPARAAGAIVTAGLIPGRPAPLKSAEEVRAGASDLYKAAESSGGILNESVANKFINDLEAAKPKPIAGKVLTSEDKILHNALDEYKDLKDTKLTLSDYQRLYSSLGDKAENFVDPKTGKYNAAGAKIVGIQQNLRNHIENLPPSSIEGGKDGVDLMKRATQEWAKQARLSDVERIMTRAESMDNPATGIKSGFRTLASNPNRLRGFSDEEKAAIKYAAKSGVVTNILRLAGSRLGPLMAGAAGYATAGPLGGAINAGVDYALSSAALRAATALQARRGNNVLRTIANRGKTPLQNPLLKILQTPLPSFQSVPINTHIPANATTR